MIFKLNVLKRHLYGSHIFIPPLSIKSDWIEARSVFVHIPYFYENLLVSTHLN